jgi:hypothetical protein
MRLGAVKGRCWGVCAILEIGWVKGAVGVFVLYVK